MSRTAFWIAVLMVAAPASAHEKHELLGGKAVTLSGSVEVRTLFGSPEYDAPPDKDGRGPVWILFPGQRLGEALPDLAGGRYGDEFTLQLILDKVEARQVYENAACARVTGKLLPQYSWLHRTAVLMDVAAVTSCNE